MLVNSEDLATYLQTEFTSTFETWADLVLPTVQGVVQRYCNRVQLEQVTDDEISLPGSYSHRLHLPKGPVASVSEVSVDGTVVTDYDLVGDTLIRTGMDDDLTPFAPYQGLNWGGPEIVVAVTYTHGFTTADAPPEVTGVIYDLAARGWSNPTSVRSQSIDGYSVTFGGNLSGSSLVLNDQDMRTLRDYHFGNRSAQV